MKLFKTTNGLAKKVGAFSLIAALVFNPLAAVTQAANEISRLVPFQGRLHGTDNKAVADGVYDITFNVYDTPTGGTPSWTESHSQVSVIHGYVNVLLGAITPMDDVNYPNVTATPAYDSSKNHVDFTKKKYLGISINGGVEMFPRSQLVPSFHAFTANHADHATQADNADNLGGKAASTYAQLSHVNSADTALDNRITAVSNGLDTDVDSVSSRVLSLEGKFTGSKAKDADLLDGQTGSYYATDARMDAVEAKFTGSKTKDSDKLDGLDSANYMRQESKNGYLGLSPNGDSSTWVRTPASGLLPYQSGGYGSLGTSSWRFNDIHGNNIYDGGTLLESKYLGISSKSVDANLLDGIDSNEFLRIKSTGSNSDPNTTTSGYILTNHSNSPGLGRYWHIDTRFYSSIGGNASQHAVSYNGTGAISYVRHRYSGTWQPWSRTDNAGVPVATTSSNGLSKIASFKQGVNGNSVGENGYFWDKNTGFIMVWGYNNADIDGARWVDFPITLTKVFNVTTTLNQSAGWNGYHGVYVTNVGTGGFNANRNDDLDGSVGNFYWQAIGYKAP